ncbi:MAG: 30S ribosomal protein S8e [Candidatus Bathyarchaeia archaeon]
MPQWHGDLQKRKPTGGKRKLYRGKRRFEWGGYPAETKLSEHRSAIKFGRGGSVKVRLQCEKYVNLTDPKSKRTEKVEIERVVRNPANVDFDRRRILTRGAVISTPLGEAVVTSRPGQHGVVNALLLKER